MAFCRNCGKGHGGKCHGQKRTCGSCGRPWRMAQFCECAHGQGGRGGGGSSSSYTTHAHTGGVVNNFNLGLGGTGAEAAGAFGAAIAAAMTRSTVAPTRTAPLKQAKPAGFIEAGEAAGEPKEKKEKTAEQKARDKERRKKQQEKKLKRKVDEEVAKRQGEESQAKDGKAEQRPLPNAEPEAPAPSTSGQDHSAGDAEPQEPAQPEKSEEEQVREGVERMRLDPPQKPLDPKLQKEQDDFEAWVDEWR